MRVDTNKSHSIRLPWVRTVPALLALLSCCLLTQCGWVDPRYDALAATAETHPPRAAIVGMWHRKIDSQVAPTFWESYLFKADGTAILRLVGKSYLEKTESVRDFRWNYQGNGVWTTQWDQQGYTPTIRLSGDNLLLTGTNTGVVYKIILERVK